MKKYLLSLTVITLFNVLLSCNDDNNNHEVKVKGGEGKILIATILPNPDGQTGASYMQLVKEFTSKTIDNTSAIPIPYGGSHPLVIGNDVFVFPSYLGDSKNELLKYTYKNNRLHRTGAIKLPSASWANSIAKVSSTKAYLSLSRLGKIWIFNPSTMKKIGEIDLTSLGYKDQNPDTGMMIIRDDILFVGLNQMVGGYTSPKEYKKADVAVIDIKEDKLIKMISEETSGFSMATRPDDPSSIFIDEKKDIYISCIGGFGMMPEHKAGILRIKSGETDFDSTYQFTITGTIIENESKTPSFMSHMHYVTNGKAYGYLNIPGYYKQGEHGHSAIANRAVEIDFHNKKLKKLEGLELSNSFGIIISKNKNDLVISNSSKTNKGLYILNPDINKVGKEPILKTKGDLMFFHHFNK